MNQEKLEKYELQGSFHTLTVKTTGLIENGNKEFREVIKSNSNTDGETTTTINLNKINGDLFTFQEFQDTFEMLRNSMGLDHYRFLRADFRLDNYDGSHYQDFAKLNKYLISAMALTYEVKNCYKTDGLFSQNQLSIAIKNDYFQLENYDRNAKSIKQGRAILQSTSCSAEILVCLKLWDNDNIKKRACRALYRTNKHLK